MSAPQPVSGGQSATRQGLEGALTLRELLAVPSLGLRLLSAPEGSETVLSWAHPTELLDPRNYLSGGELVLTVGTVLAGEATRCETFVQHLVESGVSALGYGMGDVTDEVPEALVRACRHAGLTLVAVPPGVPFQAITKLLADRRADARAAPARRVQQLSTRLLGATAAGQPFDQLLDIVAGELGGRLEYREGELRWEGATPNDVRPDTSTLRHIASILALRKHGHDQAVAHRRAEGSRLLRMVAAGRADPEVLRDLLVEAGVATDRPMTLAAWPEGVADLVAARLADSAVVVDGSGAVLSVTGGDVSVIDVALDLALPCGVATVSVLGDFPLAVPIALSALGLSQRRGTPATQRDLVSFEGLMEQQPPARLEPFAESVMVPLVEHDRRHGTALVATLRAFLDGDGSIKATAGDLHLHPNSLRHRLRRISELTGRDPRVFADLAVLAIGTWAWDHRPRGRR